MFDTLLIANRGEIAVRIARTARRLGIRTVAVHSEADARAMHVAVCDEARPIGGAAPADSYLRGDRIVEAALASGAEAVHPGYGFLSENPDFVEAVERAGLVFVGPSAQAIRAMGLKGEAKRLMEEAGVPVVPGYHGIDQADVRLAQEAASIGWPVLVKAVAGGGGKGMRRVDAEADFPEALASARAEARTAFGNDTVLVEKYVETPRHIEIQVFGDGERAVHLFERDCSLQRRHQKVVEEAPAPGMTEEMRHAMGTAAVRAAEAIGYSGAGTVEFVVDASGGLRTDGFYFMEMNTRLQVEHPVTEAVVGVDLVEWQLRVAAGEGLPARQEDLSLTGHAFEARLYAEDPAAGFLPQTGRLTHLAFPPGVRADSGVRAGDAITPHYDPMIAKVVVHGSDRADALRRLRGALDRTEVAGTATNLDFLRALARSEAFAAGRVDTGLIGRELDALVASPPPEPWRLALAAVALAGLDAEGPRQRGFALWAPLVRTVALCLGGEVVEARIEVLDAHRFRVSVGGAEAVEVRPGPPWTVDGVMRPATVVHEPEGVCVLGGGSLRAGRHDPLVRASEASAGDAVEAPMPGLVRSVMAAPGAAVAAGDRLVVIEAMKMEHGLRAPRDGVIEAVLVAEGDQVEAGAPLVRFEPSG